MRTTIITALTVFLAIGMLAGFAGPVAAQDTAANATVNQGDQTNTQASSQSASVSVGGADDGDADNGDAPEEDDYDDCSGECDDADDRDGGDADDGDTGDTNVTIAQSNAQVNEQTQTAIAEATATDESTTNISVELTDIDGLLDDTDELNGDDTDITDL